MTAVLNHIEKETLPEGWVSTTLGEIGEYINGRGFKKSEWSEDGLPIIRIQDLTGTSKEQNYYKGAIEEKYIVQPGDLLISWSATLGAYIWNGPKAALNQHIFKVKSKINKKLHFYVIQNILDELYRQSHGSGMVHITKTKFETTKVNIPVSETKQEELVAKIEELFSHIDAGITALQKAKQLLKQYRQAVLKAAVTGELTKEWRGQNRDKLEPADKLLERILNERRRKWEEQQMAQFKAKGKVPKDDKWKEKYKKPAYYENSLFGIPEEWRWVHLNQLAEIVGGLTKNKKREQFEKQLPYLRVANVYADELRLEDVGQIGVQESELKRVLLEKGDLLIVEGNGSPDQIGRLAIWDGSIVKCVHQNHLIKARLIEKDIGRFIMYWLSSLGGRDTILDVASSTSGLYTLSISKIESLPIPLAPLKEMKEIQKVVSEKLSSIDRMDMNIDDQLVKAIKHKKSILASFFSGRFE